jgi:hypothetical protein
MRFVAWLLIPGFKKEGRMPQTEIILNRLAKFFFLFFTSKRILLI